LQTPESIKLTFLIQTGNMFEELMLINVKKKEFDLAFLTDRPILDKRLLGVLCRLLENFGCRGRGKLSSIESSIRKEGHKNFGT
jgi:hypothetical protein